MARNEIEDSSFESDDNSDDGLVDTWENRGDVEKKRKWKLTFA